MVYGDNINISNDTGIIDLSNFFVDKPKFKLHSMIDRMWFKYQKNKIEISIGRQRVNWGINTIWNSNDLFNAYNFIDFDYIERPGSDVIRFIYNGDNLSSLEFVYKPNLNNIGVIAALYKINKIGYDFQFFGANYYDQDWKNGTNGTTLEHYKIIGGGHSWPKINSNSSPILFNSLKCLVVSVQV